MVLPWFVTNDFGLPNLFFWIAITNTSKMNFLIYVPLCSCGYLVLLGPVTLPSPRHPPLPSVRNHVVSPLGQPDQQPQPTCRQGCSPSSCFPEPHDTLGPSTPHPPIWVWFTLPLGDPSHLVQFLVLPHNPYFWGLSSIGNGPTQNTACIFFLCMWLKYLHIEKKMHPSLCYLWPTPYPLGPPLISPAAAVAT